MDIGLGLNGTHRGGGGGAGAGDETLPVPGTLAPIPGILDAPALVALGASIMEGAFEAGTAGVTDPLVQTYAAAMGFTGTVYTYAVAGHTLSATPGRHADADTALAATRGSNVYLMHTGGNNVSGSRPYPNDSASFSTQYDALLDQILANAGDKLVAMPLTKRFYGKFSGYTDPDSVNPAIPASDANGSAPYNDNIIIPKLRARTPLWCEPDARPFVDPYMLTERHPWITGGDGIHGAQSTMARFILARVAARAKGIRNGASRTGQAFLYAPRKVDGDLSAPGAKNIIGCLGSPGLLHAAINTAGALDHFIEGWYTGPGASGTTDVSPTAADRVADARLHPALDAHIFLGSGNTADIGFDELVPGDVMTLKACASKNAGGATVRSMTMVLTAGGVTQTRVLDAKNNAVSNMVTFDPVTIPADGRVTLTCTSTNQANGFGYLSGILIDFG